MDPMKKVRFLGIIPARGGSKGLPRKNIMPIAGKPLIAWSIESARNAAMLDDFVVSTEDAEIASIAEGCGAKVIKRPPELSTDDASPFSVMKHILGIIDAEHVVLLQPTSPVRDEGLIDDCIDAYIKKGSDTLATGFICKYAEYGKAAERRQDMEGFFYDDGNLYIWNADIIKSNEKYGKKIERYLIDKAQNTDINDMFDLWVAEQILLKKMADAK